MRLAKLIPALAVLLSLSTPLLAQEWAGRGRIQGTIKDENGKAVEGASVTLRKDVDHVDPKTPGPAPIKTDSKGRWSMLGLAGGNWAVLIEKEGFISSEGAVQVSEFGPAPPVNVTLRTVPKEQIEAAQKQAEQASAGGQAKAALDNANQLLTAAQAAPEAQKKQKMTEALAAYQDGLDKLAAIKAEKPEQQTAIDTTKISVLQTMAGIDYEIGQTDDAVAKLKQVLAAKPGDPAVLQLMIDMLVQAGREEEAKQYMAQMPAGAKMDAETVLNMGIKAFNANQMDKAFGYFDQVVKDHPERPDAYYYRGLVYLNRGKHAEAKADFQKLLQLDPNGKFADDAKAFLKDIK
jgi:tetratricopeptide (TPR) repeat protein